MSLRTLLVVATAGCLLASALLATPLLVAGWTQPTGHGTLSAASTAPTGPAGSGDATGILPESNDPDETTFEGLSDEDGSPEDGNDTGEDAENGTVSGSAEGSEPDGDAGPEDDRDTGDDRDSDADHETEGDRQNDSQWGDDGWRSGDEGSEDGWRSGDHGSKDGWRSGDGRSGESWRSGDESRPEDDRRGREEWGPVVDHWARGVTGAGDPGAVTTFRDRPFDPSDSVGLEAVGLDFAETGIGRFDAVTAGVVDRYGPLSGTPLQDSPTDGAAAADGDTGQDGAAGRGGAAGSAGNDADDGDGDRNETAGAGWPTDGAIGSVDRPVAGPAAAGALLLVGGLGGLFASLATGAPPAVFPTGSRTAAGGLRRILGLLVEAGSRVLPLGIPLGYGRADGSDPLDNETRALMYDVVEESPGVYHAKLADAVGVAEETVRYHSRVLVEEGLVECHKHRGRRRLYPVRLEATEQDVAAAVADSAAADVLSIVGRREPTTLSEVAETLERAPSTVAHHLDRLEADGLVRRTREGRSVSVSLKASARSALDGSVSDD